MPSGFAKPRRELEKRLHKACIRFKKVGDLPLDLIGEAIKRVPAPIYIEFREASLTPAPKPAGGKQN